MNQGAEQLDEDAASDSVDFSPTSTEGSSQYNKHPLTGVTMEVLAGEFARELPENLYHYTSSAGLFGIVSSGALWFSDASFLNDGSEVLYGLQIFDEIVAPYSREQDDFAQEAIIRLRQLLSTQAFEYRQAVFCMCTEENLLNQWRDYGSSQTAYCIGFDVTDLIKTIKDFTFNAMLFPVIYEKSKQIELMKEFLSVMVARVQLIGDELKADTTKLSVALSVIAAEVSWLLCRFKNSAFAAENEWRLLNFIHYADNLVQSKFRSTNLGVVPYYIWKRGQNAKLPISSVMVGPTPYASASEVALSLFMNKSGYKVQTSHSTIPIRR